jgi:hypothetical protein
MNLKYHNVIKAKKFLFEKIIMMLSISIGITAANIKILNK